MLLELPDQLGLAFVNDCDTSFTTEKGGMEQQQQHMTTKQARNLKSSAFSRMAHQHHHESLWI